MKTSKVVVTIALMAILCFVAIPLVINLLFEGTAPCETLQAKWSAGDALGYAAGSLTFIGTMFLGWVSWKQNQTLQAREDESFIADNSCMVLIEKMVFHDLQRKAINIPEHCETLLCDDADAIQNNKYSTIECDITLKHIKNYPVVVRAIRGFLQIGNDMVALEKIDDFYTRLAVQNNKSQFQLTTFLSSVNITKIKKAIRKGDFKIKINLEVELISNERVSTQLKLRSTLYKENADETAINYNSQEDSSMVFWYGNNIVSLDAIRFRKKE